VAAGASLLERRGRRVVRIGEDLHDARLDPSFTVVLLDAGPLGTAERRRLARFVRAGGRLVAGGEGAGGAVAEVLAAPPRRVVTDAPARGRPVAPVPEAAGELASAGEAEWSRAGDALPAIGGPDGDLLLVARAGRGSMALLADPSPLHNRRHGEAGNAAVALALAPPGRTVAFVESVHGYGAGEGLGALPPRWKALLLGLVFAALVLIAAHARRLGPPEDTGRPAPPPRARFVEAVGRTLARTDDPAAIAESLRHTARRAVLARSGLDAQAPEADVRAAARRAGLDEDEARVVAAGATGPADMLVAARAVARINRGGT
jgi:hypothetical protein